MSQAYFDSLRALAPELVLTLTAFACLFAGLRGSRLAGWIALVGLCAASALIVARAGVPAEIVFTLVRVDHFASFFKLLMTAGAVVVVLSWMFERSDRRALPAEAFFLLLGALLGGFLMVGTNHALLLVLGFELMSLASCALAGLDRDRAASGEAAMKSFVFKSFATVLMIYGLSLLYGLTGTLDFARMGAADISGGMASLAQQSSGHSLPVSIALILVLVGFAAKISLVPLQFWTPDVYEGSPPQVAMFFAVVSRAAGFGALLRCLSALFVNDGVSRTMLHYASKFGLLLAILAALTMTLGSLGALRQVGLKRLLAYSSIAQSGFAMIGIACLNETGFSAALMYIAICALMTAGAFTALIHLEGIVGSDRLDDMRGQGWKSPIVGVGMILLLASLTGLPPTVGFYGKYRLFIEAWNAGFSWVVLVAAINTLVSVFTLVRVARVLFFAAPSEGRADRARVLVTIAVALSIATLVLGVWTRPIELWATSGLDLLRATR